MSQNFDKSVLESQLRKARVTTLTILNEFVNSPVITTKNLSNATPYRDEKLGGQMATLSRMGLIQGAGTDEDRVRRWQLNPGIDKDWLKNLLNEINVDTGNGLAG